MTERFTPLGGSHSDAHEEEECEILTFQPAHVYDAHSLEEEVPEGYDAVKIVLDGSLQADLSWTKEKEAAKEYIKKGKRIFWEIDLGLFQQLGHPLSHQSQFLSLALSLEHFKDTLWKEFRHHSVGLCLYRGKANFIEGFRWDEAQTKNFQELYTDQIEENPALFCSGVCSEYLNLLGSRLPDEIACFVLLDATELDDRLLIAQLLNKERYPRFHIIVKDGKGCGGEFIWKDRQLMGIQNEKACIGICLPSLEREVQTEIQILRTVMQDLHDKKRSFKVISESTLTTEWDGLDFLIVNSSSVSHQGRRKLNGFCAAGGCVVTIGELLGVAEEISLSEFFTRKL